MKQIVSILDAIDAGASTSVEIAAHTDLRVSTVAAWLCQLKADGLIEQTGQRRYSERGRPAKEYRRMG